MKKEFNDVGLCIPHLHYMMDTSQKLGEVMTLVENGKYFVIARPRQYGKTTLLSLLEQSLIEREVFVPIKMNFQGVDSVYHESDESFASYIFENILDFLEYSFPDLYQQARKESLPNMRGLSKFITSLVKDIGKKVVLLIDEVDASSEFDPFLTFLGMLRTKYLDRFSPHHQTFYSVVLAGVHNIKSLKLKMASSDDLPYNSPWNIAADFNVRMSFNAKEIAPMLAAYSQAEQVKLDIETIAQRLYYYTSGYPYLVSKLCKIMAEQIVAKRTLPFLELEDVDQAAQRLLKETNTNFDHLIKNLETQSELYEVVRRLIIEGERIPFNQYNPILEQGFRYGIFKANHNISIHNRMYEQLIYDYMISKISTDLPAPPNKFMATPLLNHKLNLKTVLHQFQQFMKEQFSHKQTDFLEKQWQLVFLAYLTPIINGKGYAFKEVQTSQEKRLDVVITFMNERYIVELKRWYGPQAHKHGLAQLADYLDIHGVDEGYLLIFDQRKEKEWKQEEVVYQEKRIFAVWV